MSPRERKRDEILAAAVEIFVSCGYRSTTMDDVAQQAGCSKPVIYQHFSNKLDLYLAVLQNSVDLLVTGFHEALFAAVDNESRVRAAVGAYFEFVDQETHHFRLVFESDAVNEPAVQRMVADAVDSCIEAVYREIARHSGSYSHRSRLLAVGLVGASQIAARHWLDSNKIVPKAQAIATTANLCWAGLSDLPSQIRSPLEPGVA